MTKLVAHRTNCDPKDYGSDFLIHPASKESVRTVLAANEDCPDGRSNWVWLRLPNGDLALGVFPQGDTYFDVEIDAHYPDADGSPSGKVVDAVNSAEGRIANGAGIDAAFRWLRDEIAQINAHYSGD